MDTLEGIAFGCLKLAADRTPVGDDDELMATAAEFMAWVCETSAQHRALGSTPAAPTEIEPDDDLGKRRARLNSEVPAARA